MEESFGVPAPVGVGLDLSWALGLLDGVNVGVSDLPLLVSGSVQVLGTHLEVVDTSETSLWLNNLSVDPQEGSIPLGS